jgi:hypothetical protein
MLHSLEPTALSSSCGVFPTSRNASEFGKSSPESVKYTAHTVILIFKNKHLLNWPPECYL